VSTILETFHGRPDLWESQFDEEMEDIRSLDTVPLDIKNVIRYTSEHPEAGKQVTRMPITPPWFNTWVEYTYRRTQEDYAFCVTTVEMETRDGKLVEYEGEEVRWTMLWTPFRRKPHQESIDRGMQWVTHLRADGSIVTGDRNAEGVETLRVFAYRLPDTEEDHQLFTQFLEIMTPHMTLVSFAFALLNCKNVVVEDEVIPPKLAAKRLKHHGMPSIVKKVLRVEPLRDSVRRSSGQSVPDPDRSERAFHLRRGYFADYREGNGLFGKHHGVYWWDQMTRGSRGAGEILKSYELKV
jgi:hypothetical protein